MHSISVRRFSAWVFLIHVCEWSMFVVLDFRTGIKQYWKPLLGLNYLDLMLPFSGSLKSLLICIQTGTSFGSSWRVSSCKWDCTPSLGQTNRMSSEDISDMFITFLVMFITLWSMLWTFLSVCHQREQQDCWCYHSLFWEALCQSQTTGSSTFEMWVSCTWFCVLAVELWLVTGQIVGSVVSHLLH